MAPAQIAKYRIDGILGEGAMGIVYKAFDPHIERVVALKTIRKALLRDGDDSQIVTRFKNEAQAAGRLTHQNIVGVYEYGETEEAAFIAMEYVEGRPLTDSLAQGRPVGLAQAMAWMTQLLSALAYAHARGVVHRDIKPANLMITSDAILKIADFGIARIESSTLTQTGVLIGTPSYMSPEQFRGEAVDGRSDVFSAGIVLYQLLTGVRPFVGNSATVMQQILNEQAVPPSQRAAQLHPAFDEVLRHALEKAPARRYAAAEQFLAALQQAHAQGGNDGEMPAPDDDDRTVFAGQISARGGFRVQPGAPGSQAGSDRPMSIAGTNDTGGAADAWKLATFPDLEAALSAQIGPIARVLLKRAGARAENFDELGTLLAPHIPSESGRSAFQAALGKCKAALSTGGTPGGTTTSTAAVPAGHDAPSSLAAAGAGNVPVSAELIAHAETLLPQYIGAIAKIIIRRSVNKAGNSADFLAAISSAIEAESEREKFLKTIKSLIAR